METLPGGEERGMLLCDDDVIHDEEFSPIVKALAVREVRTPDYSQ
jgi:hypothetical protein